MMVNRKSILKDKDREMREVAASADNICSLKDNLDAVSWSCIKSLTADMTEALGAGDVEKAKLINEEIAGIAIDNIRVLYRFGFSEDELVKSDVDSGMQLEGEPPERTHHEDVVEVLRHSERTGQVDLDGLDEFLESVDEEEPSRVPVESVVAEADSPHDASSPATEDEPLAIAQRIEEIAETAVVPPITIKIPSTSLSADKIAASEEAAVTMADWLTSTRARIIGVSDEVLPRRYVHREGHGITSPVAKRESAVDGPDLTAMVDRLLGDMG